MHTHVYTLVEYMICDWLSSCVLHRDRDRDSDRDKDRDKDRDRDKRRQRRTGDP